MAQEPQTSRPSLVTEKFPGFSFGLSQAQHHRQTLEALKHDLRS